jgi:hypothetical protein
MPLLHIVCSSLLKFFVCLHKNCSSSMFSLYTAMCFSSCCMVCSLCYFRSLWVFFPNFRLVQPSFWFGLIRFDIDDLIKVINFLFLCMLVLLIVCCYLFKLSVCLNHKLLLYTILHEAKEFRCHCLKTCTSPATFPTNNENTEPNNENSGSSDPKKTEKGNINFTKFATFTKFSNYMSLKCSISHTSDPQDIEGNLIPNIPEVELLVTKQQTHQAVSFIEREY